MSGAYQQIDVEAQGGARRSSYLPDIIPHAIGEQSTVTILVASAFCCCFLFLACVAAACAYLFLLIWGAYILDDSSAAMDKDDVCESKYHIWTFCLLNEFVGLAIMICGCGEACRIYGVMTSESESSSSSVSGCPFVTKYLGSFILTLGFFVWGMIEWFSVSDKCITEIDDKFEALLLLFRTGVIADALILLICVSCFILQRSSGSSQSGDSN